MSAILLLDESVLKQKVTDALSAELRWRTFMEV